MTASTKRTVLYAAVVGMAIVAFGLPYALGRHFHVDEAQLVANSALLARGGRVDFLNYVTPYSVTMSWFLHGLNTTAIYAVMRASSFAVFVAILTVFAFAQPHFTSPLGRAFALAFVGVDYLLWSHGFELRHDIVSLLGFVILFGLAHREPRRNVWLAAGFVAATMQVHSGKALIFSGPALLVMFVMGRGNLRAAGSMALGALAAIGVAAMALAATGTLGRYLSLNFAFASFVAAATRFSPISLLLHIARMAPVTLFASLAAVALTVRELVRREIEWRSAAVTTHLFLLIAIAAVLINPTPFTYNAIYVAPFLAASSLQLFSRWSKPVLPAVAIAIAAFFFHRHLTREPQAAATNAVQLSIARAAEAMTTPDDPVLDGAGLVATRNPPARDWILHSVLRAAYAAGQRESFSAIMRRDAPPFVVVSYRWVWLKPEDWKTLSEMYVAISTNVRVLGGIANGDFTIHRAGRYVVECGNGPKRILELPRGVQHNDCGGPVAYYWIGPTLTELPVIATGAPSSLFVSD
jgi:hypothetical protein